MKRIGWMLLFVCALAGCSGLFFYPHKLHVRTPDLINLEYRDVYFTTLDGVNLHGWFLPAQGRTFGTVLFLHGNAENISTHIGSVYWLPERGFNVFLFDYRGYGWSRGKPSIAGVQQDAQSAITHIMTSPNVDAQRVVVFGQSLGGALAVTAVANSEYHGQIKALVTESAFSSYRRIFREKAASFWLTWPLQWPLSWTVSDRYSPEKFIKHISPIPLLVIHGDRDEIIPIHHGRRLYDEADVPKEFWLVENGRHTEAFRHKGFRDRFVRYLKDKLNATQAAAVVTGVRPGIAWINPPP